MPLATQIRAKVNTTIYNLTDGTIGYRLLDEGLAMAPIRRLSERGPLQHGTTDLGFRLDPRKFMLTLTTPPAAGLDVLYNNRKTLINIFKPLTTIPIQIEYTLANGDVRQLDCFVDGDFRIDETDRQGFMQKVGISLMAPDPTFYDPTPQTLSFILPVGTNPTTVPLAVPMYVGSTNINQTTAFPYVGTWQTNPVITITGPISSPVITNQTTGEKLDFTGTLILNGDVWTIDTRYGYKTVKDSSGNNQIAALSDDSNLSTFHLDVDPVAAGGINNINITNGAATQYTSVVLSFYNRYIGI
jgi:hypothetical protein